MNKPENNERKENIDENGKIITRDHLLIRDKESGEILLNRREMKGGKACLTK